MAEQQPIIVIKKIKKGGHAHHGGAWKLAYADFVTAMMAFFLLMWLLASTDEISRQGIAEFFSNPYKVSLEGGKESASRTSMVDGGGSDLISKTEGQVKNESSPEEIEREEIEKKAEEAEKTKEEAEKVKLEALKEKLNAKINETPELNEFKDQIKLQITPEGLRILLVDDQNRPMYKLASAQTEQHVRIILNALAPVINELPNKISLNGHTDAHPFPVNQKGYTNWELSSDRANAARYELIGAGLAESKILRVIGMSSSVPYNSSTNPLDPINRRISILVLNKKTENQVLQGSTAE